MALVILIFVLLPNISPSRVQTLKSFRCAKIVLTYFHPKNLEIQFQAVDGEGLVSGVGSSVTFSHTASSRGDYLGEEARAPFRQLWPLAHTGLKILPVVDQGQELTCS